MSGRNRLQWLERAFMVAGSAAAVIFLCMSLPAVMARVQSVHTPASTDAPEIPASLIGSAYLHGSTTVSDGTDVATLSIPELRLNAPIIEGVTDGDLRRGIGHVAGSAMGGGLGNMVLAAHRDTIFRPLRSIRKGMDIQIKGVEGTYHYQVDSLEVVAPDRLDVLEIASQPQVTLITCYPFNFIGSAPMRFIVKAHLVSAMPDSSGQ